MDLFVLDKEYNQLGIIDVYNSLIWTDRFREAGDFELDLAVTVENLDMLRPDHYLWSKESDHTMIIERVTIDSDAEDGSHLLINGRSLESILDRRIVWQQTMFTGSVQNGIKKLINDAFIAPADNTRRVNNLIFEESTNPLITLLSVESAQYTGDNLYDIITDLCEVFDIGFKIILDDVNVMHFELYTGEDRTYDQYTNPYIIFSPNYENLLNSNYYEDNTNAKTITLVAGEGEGSDRTTVSVEVKSGAKSGLDRRELYTDARDLSSTVYDDSGESKELSPQEYRETLINRGSEKLAEMSYIKSFEGELDSTLSFSYRNDYKMGDIVQVENEYGIERKSRIIEYIRSQDSSGIKEYPTFLLMEEE